MTEATKEMRPAMRAEDPRARAEARYKELIGVIEDGEDAPDEFRAPQAPDGWTYEWKRELTLNQEDPSYQVELAQTGWEAVSTSRHPEFMPKSGEHPLIRRKGMILMERPTAIVEAVKARDLKSARKQVRDKEAQLGATPDGHLPRDADARTKPRVSKSMEPMAIPD